MKNKINKFKQLSQEFADRKGYGVEFEEVDNLAMKNITAKLLKDREYILGFMFLINYAEYNVFDKNQYFFNPQKDLTLDQFKKLMEEL